MKVYQSKLNALGGTDYKEVYPVAYGIFRKLKKQTKRKPYIRSAYFNKEKIFLDYFWQHLHQKNWWDQVRRLRFYECALDLIKNTRSDPFTAQDPNKPKRVLHRFSGKTSAGDGFIVQIVEDKRTKQKYFISVFPK
jgi:hypothetical protein